MARLGLEVTGSGTPPSASKHDSRSSSFEHIASAIFFFLGGMIVLVIFLIIFFVLKKFVRTADLKKFIARKLNGGSPPEKIIAKVQCFSSTLHDIIHFDFLTLKKATKNFHRSNLLGKGGFGPVYLGKLEDGRLVAVKQLSLGKSQQGESEFLAEVKLITSIQHKNVLRLLGCCSDGAQRLLVYEYMKNGSLDLIVYGKKDVFLNWNTRCQIILGIARGLQYLHEDSHLRIVHRDIKASNILLDDKFQPRIGDFGLARFFPEDQAFLSATFGGTLGYTAPEYAIRGELSEKSDIYSFGVLVLEIISCRKNTDYELPMEMQYLPEYACKLNEKSKLMDLLDPKLRDDEVAEKDVMQVLNVALSCLQQYASLRPPMSEVVAMLTCMAEARGELIRPALMKQNIEKQSGETISVEFSPSFQSTVSITYPKPESK